MSDFTDKNRLDALERDLRALNEEVYRTNFSSTQDFPKYSRFNTRLKVPTVTAVAATCEIGELCVVSSTGKLYVCSATNTWTIAGTQS
jgi:hypothetical protein